MIFFDSIQFFIDKIKNNVFSDTVWLANATILMKKITFTSSNNVKASTEFIKWIVQKPILKSIICFTKTSKAEERYF
jgi:hypothetical protein